MRKALSGNYLSRGRTALQAAGLSRRSPYTTYEAEDGFKDFFSNQHLIHLMHHLVHPLSGSPAMRQRQGQPLAWG